MGIFDKAKDLIGSNPDKAHQIIDQAGDLADQKTGGKYAGQVDQGQDFVKGQLGAEQAEAPASSAPEAPQAFEGEQPPAPEGEQPPAPEGEQPPA